MEGKSALLADYLSSVGARRQPSPIRKLGPLMTLPGMISLGGGLPNSTLFPFKGLSFTLSTGETITLTSQELTEALQYGPTPGLPALLKELRMIQKREHILPGDPRPDSAWSISVTNGSQDALAKAFETFVQEGDNVLVESPTYSGTLAILRPLGCSLIAVETDQEGLIPSSLEQALRKTYSRPPRILYTIVTGQNPSGATLTLERKKRIYELACEFNLLILEDDPYRYLEYGSAPAPPAGSDHLFQCPHSQSLFSMDRQARVLRFDSLSKALSSGLRLGFVTGPTAFVNQIDLVSQATTLHSSGVAQMMVAKLLQAWGEQGWATHCRAVALFYARRRDVFMALCEKHLKGLAEWNAPSAGMFVWLRLLHVADSQKLIEQKAVDAKVLLLHGACFLPGGGLSSYVRASFSVASDSDMDVALQRFASLLRAEQARPLTSAL